MEPAAVRDRVGRRASTSSWRSSAAAASARCSTRCAATASAGRALRVLTTTYTGSTERRALDQLAELGAEVRVSYDLSTHPPARQGVAVPPALRASRRPTSARRTSPTRRRSPAWSGTSGSRPPATPTSSTSSPPCSRATGRTATSSPTTPTQFDEEQRRAGGADRGPQVILSPIELRPEPFQERLLEQIELSRQRGHHRNLLVAATGTGKTVMAAVDYAPPAPAARRARACCSSPTARRSSTRASPPSATPCATPPSARSGSAAPDRTRFEHVFASIQSLNASGLADLAARPLRRRHRRRVPPRRGAVVHAASSTTSRPVELLGLTATPERSDGLPILHWFDDRIAAELRLWDAIDQQRLAPFLYFGIHDGLDLRDIPWRRGRGYDVEALSNRLHQLRRLGSPRRAAGRRARRAGDDALPRVLRERRARPVHGPPLQRATASPSVAVWGDSPRAEREAALRDLAAGEVELVFSVDLFNEGVDVPPSTPC